jgi:HEAT repeats
MRFFRSVGGLLLGEDELRVLAKLRRERRYEPRLWAARLACALGVALVGIGTGYWFVALILAAIVLAGKRTQWLVYAPAVGLLFALPLLVAELATGANPYVALFFAGGPAVLFGLGIVLALTGGVGFSGHWLTARRLRREHDAEGLIALLADRDPATRAKAADVLAPFADPRAEEPLLRALADPDPDVRANGARALGELKSEAAVERLLRALGDEDDLVRYMAAWALGRIGDPRAIAPLRRLVTDDDGPAQDAARDALRSLSTSAAITASPN